MTFQIISDWIFNTNLQSEIKGYSKLANGEDIWGYTFQWKCLRLNWGFLNNCNRDFIMKLTIRLVQGRPCGYAGGRCTASFMLGWISPSSYDMQLFHNFSQNKKGWLVGWLVTSLKCSPTYFPIHVIVIEIWWQNLFYLNFMQGIDILDIRYQIAIWYMASHFGY